MEDVIARIGVYGDLHLCDHDYGAHNDYAKESLEYFGRICEIAERRQCTHMIGTGDFTFGKFSTLEYRESVEGILQRLMDLTKGNHYQLLGNHDTATNGMTEYQYYIRKKLMIPSQNLKLGALNITMLDYGKPGSYTHDKMNIVDSLDSINVVIGHQYFKFSDSDIPNFGNRAILLDDFEPFYGADFLLCGHIHHRLVFKGSIAKNGTTHPLTVHYLGCMMRPAYREGLMDEKGCVAVLTVYSDGHMDYDVEETELWPLDKSFNLVKKEKEKEKKELKDERVDISDIVKNLDAHDRTLGDPEEIIKNLTGFKDAYKERAIQLLRDAG